MDCLEQMVCFVFVALQGNLKMQNENCKMQILREWFCILQFSFLIFQCYRVTITLYEV